MLNALRGLWQQEDGQGMVEYGLILALVAIVVVVVLTTMGESIKATFQKIIGHLPTATT